MIAHAQFLYTCQFKNNTSCYTCMGLYNCELSGIRVVYICGVLKLSGRYSSASTVCGVCYRNIIMSVVFFLFTVMKLLQRWKHEDVYTHPPMAVSLPKVNVNGSAKTSLMDQNIMSYLSSDTFRKS